MKTLLVGGRSDGKWAEVDNEAISYHVCSPDYSGQCLWMGDGGQPRKPHKQVDTYLLLERYDDTQIFIAIGWSFFDTMKALMDGYSKSKEKTL